jgi:hypothetical protein
MQAKLLQQNEIDHCKAICKNYFEQKHLNVVLDQPIAANIDWSPMIYAKNGEQYGVDVKTKPALETFWLETYRINVRPNQPTLNICLAFPFDIALRLSPETLKAFIEEKLSIFVVHNDDSVDFFKHNQSHIPSRAANSIIDDLRNKKAKLLSSQLVGCGKGRNYFSEYEKICLDIFKTLFVPPLSLPSSQVYTVSHIRRRDHIFPNHAKEGFWFDVVKQTYKGNYVLLECKNLEGKVTINEIEDAAKYLFEKGTGLFGLILSREAASPNAKKLQIDKWTNEGKLIIVLTDDDLLTLIECYRNQQDPSVHVQNKIDEFMLAVE